MSYLLLDVIDEMHLLQPSSNIQLSAKNPDRFLTRACEHHPPGLGPAVDLQRRHGRRGAAAAGQAIEDARAGGTSGCVETGAFGKEAYILTGYFNLPKVSRSR